MNTLAAAGIIVNPNGRSEQRTSCPQCSQRERDDSLGVNVDTGAFHCFRCGWKGRAGGEQTTPIRVMKIDDPAVAERKRERLRKTWRESISLSHSRAYAVRRYFEARALGEILKSPPKVLRAHPGLEYWDGTTSLGTFPAMLALFAGAAGDPATIHATFLRADGCTKAGVPSPKKILGVPQRGATKGGAVRLFEARGNTLGVAEGIESALSLHLIRKIPVWASFCAGNLERIRLPDGLRELQIGVDLDESGVGEKVAQALAQRVMRWSKRIRVIYIKPELDGPGDLNDELRRRRA